MRNRAPAGADRYARQTAADRPGVAQPVPVRPVPQQPWGRILIGMLVLLALLLGGWEWYWRAFGATPGISNSNGLWAIQRARLDHGEGDATVLVGDSRLLFDTRLPLWQKLEGRRPIQLCLEGTSGRWTLEDLAADPKFTGRVVVGVAPFVFFSGFDFRRDAITLAHKESPSQRVGQWLSMHFIEPYFAFDDPDFALQTVLARQPWPERMPERMDVRKLSVHEADRNTYMWSKVETDPAYRAIAQKVWLSHLRPLPGDPPLAVIQHNAQEQIEKTAAAVATLRARGVQVVFVLMPSAGPFLAFEQQVFPRQDTWDQLLRRTGAPGIHFQDYPQLQGLNLPEWSHLSYADSERFTAALQPLVAQKFATAPPATAQR
ncbi:MAG: hypothetical protein JOZ67_01635 [Gammaproteobacteria bacterium]|nr:hypothetical protein [Gammaproteobacteria bacterium]